MTLSFAIVRPPVQPPKPAARHVTTVEVRSDLGDLATRDDPGDALQRGEALISPGVGTPNGTGEF
jgi:hypothetical protein